MGQVRITRSDDISLLKRLHVDTFPADDFPRFTSGWWWVARQGEVAVAFCGVQPSAHWGDCVYLVRAGVMPSHRGLGLQKRLIKVRERFARQMGASWSITYTYRNPASSNSLIRCGYRIYEPASPWGPAGSIYWRKPL